MGLLVFEWWTHPPPVPVPLLPLASCLSWFGCFYLVFAQKWWFYGLRRHLVGGTKDCDHWHQGAGFVTSHMALTLMFEQAVQSVNPAVSMPYWDFTLESTFFGASDFRTSGVFADDWFGEASTNNVRWRGLPGKQ